MAIHPADEVFKTLIDIMERDNGCEFHYTQEQMERAIPHIRRLQLSGYFDDMPAELDSDFWEMVAGEEEERRVRFSLAPEAFEGLSAILDEVFEG